jgi:glucosamine-6-phosphate deaminase
MNVFRFDSESSWIDGVVCFWLDRLRANPRLRMCLTSGHTPLPIYETMARAVWRTGLSFRRAEVFALDDFGGLAQNDPGRCSNMLRRHFVSRTDLPASRFHTLDTEAKDLRRICRDYDARIGTGFDLAILGLGLNGHLGLNEPGSSPRSTTRRVDLHPSTIAASAKYLTHSRLPTWGVGVGLRHLLGTREVWLLANGPKKAAIVRRTLKGAVTAQTPASWLQRHKQSFVFLEAAAAAQL